MHGSVTKYGHRAGLAGAGVLARMILASFWMKIPVAYRRRYGGEGLGFGQESPMLLGNLDETSFPSLERSMRFSRHELARAPEPVRKAIVAASYSRGKLSIDRASMAMIQLRMDDTPPNCRLAEHDIPWVTIPHAAARIPSRAQRCNLITVPPANRAAASSPVRDPLLRLALTCPSAPLLWLAGQPLERVIIPKYFYALLSSSFPPLLPFLTFSSHSSLSISLSLLTFIPLLRSSPSSSSSFFRRVSRRIPPIEFPNPPMISPRFPTLSRSETGPFSSPEAPSPQVTHANVSLLRFLACFFSSERHWIIRLTRILYFPSSQLLRLLSLFSRSSFNSPPSSLPIL
ncbi:uncharacterized protein An04g02080 [Aspergillus niger]|uniref:Contig An04c0100, genomic contig n=2 Tax=Aspergillus niger TaxID=5061 RepID=A2QI30_ASPNC|nr:uncharacterized protein An04g02080 [Aspergillus niger]CAL00695.1 unnamed protein product [Aspergillus niger]